MRHGLLAFLESPSEMHSSNPPNRSLLSTYYVPGTVLGPGDIAVKKTDKIPTFLELTLFGRDKQETSEYMMSGADEHMEQSKER